MGIVEGLEGLQVESWELESGGVPLRGLATTSWRQEVQAESLEPGFTRWQARAASGELRAGAWRLGNGTWDLTTEISRRMLLLANVRMIWS